MPNSRRLLPTLGLIALVGLLSASKVYKNEDLTRRSFSNQDLTGSDFSLATLDDVRFNQVMVGSPGTELEFAL